jgi:biotin operon repressor
MWQESELLSDWLVARSSINTVIKKFANENYLPTIKGVRVKEQAKLIAQSNEFYKKLGIPVEGKVFGLNGLTPEINKKPIENLNNSEKKLMKLLIQNENETVEIDEIGDEIFGTDSDYSLYAISKMVERLRKKLEANGISGSYIQTLRGKGYLLKN